MKKKIVKKSTALARRKPAKLVKRQPAKRGELVRASKVPVVTNAVATVERLTDEAMIVPLATMPALTAKQNEILDRGVKLEDVRIKPTGQVYLSHPVYIKWFNEAFGRGQWGLQQIQKPQKVDSKNGATILILYAFAVNGVAIFSATGEAEYHETNKEQTFGDVIEATHAYALRRFAKRLGVGLEMWDKPFCDAFLDRYGVKVWLDGQAKPVWRRKVDPPFWNEVAGRGQQRQQRQEQQEQGRHDRRPPPPQPRAEQPRTEAPAGSNPKGEEVITDAQRDRFWTIAGTVGRSKAEIGPWLSAIWGYSSSRYIKRKDYEAVCAALEYPGPLAGNTDRVPGEDDQ